MRFFGWVSIIVGTVLVLLCGSCTAYWGGTSANDLIQCQGHSSGDETCDSTVGLAQFLLLCALVLGGPPTVLGIVLVVIGIVMQRRRRAAAAAPGRPQAEPPSTQVWS